MKDARVWLTSTDYERLCDAYPILEEEHTIAIADGFCESITVAEFDRQVASDSHIVCWWLRSIIRAQHMGTYTSPSRCRIVAGHSRWSVQKRGTGCGPVWPVTSIVLLQWPCGMETGESIDIDDPIGELEEAIEVEGIQ